jgi:hypothetical protein
MYLGMPCMTMVNGQVLQVPKKQRFMLVMLSCMPQCSLEESRCSVFVI